MTIYRRQEHLNSVPPIPYAHALLSMSVVGLLLILSVPANSKVWVVGHTRQYKYPSAVMPLVGTGDTVDIDADLYVGDVGTWTKDSLVLRCPTGLAHLEAAGSIAQRKAIWVLEGNHTYVEGIEFSGAVVADSDGGNGAGIRLSGLGLECRRCHFLNNQEGILTGNDTTNDILIEACNFFRNGVETDKPGLFQHQIYIGHSRSFTMKYCNIYGSMVGHEVKSRANRNYILYNLILDGPDGDGSYSIDIPNGGFAVIIGNSIHKGPKTGNSTVIDYGGEGLINPDSGFYFINNTVVTDRNPTTYFSLAPGTVPKILNNIFAGKAHPIDAADTAHNVQMPDTSIFVFADFAYYIYRPTWIFPGYYKGIDPGNAHGFSLTPTSEYKRDRDSTPRIWNGGVGAYNAPPTVGVTTPTVQSSTGVFPNPFSQSATILLPEYLAESKAVRLQLYNNTGTLVRNDSYESVEHRLQFDRGHLPVGIYYYRITSQNSSHMMAGTMAIE